MIGLLAALLLSPQVEATSPAALARVARPDLAADIVGAEKAYDEWGHWSLVLYERPRPANSPRLCRITLHGAPKPIYAHHPGTVSQRWRAERFLLKGKARRCADALHLQNTFAAARQVMRDGHLVDEPDETVALEGLAKLAHLQTKLRRDPNPPKIACWQARCPPGHEAVLAFRPDLIRAIVRRTTAEGPGWVFEFAAPTSPPDGRKEPAISLIIPDEGSPRLLALPGRHHPPADRPTIWYTGRPILEPEPAKP
jgi:hypothetical protein